MERNTAIVLTTFAIGYFTVLIFSTGAFSFEFPVNANGEEYKGVNHIVELQDGIVILSSLTTEHYISHSSVGTIQISEDGSTCWVTTEKIGSLYYKITECSENV
jgi:hypothetical protein